MAGYSDMFDIGVTGNLRAGRTEVSYLEVMHIVIAGEPGKVLQLLITDLEKELKHPRRNIDLQPFPQIRVLGSHPDRAFPCSAETVLLAATGHQG